MTFNGSDFRFKSEPVRFVARYLIFDFLSIMLTYGIFTLLKGNVIVSFSPDISDITGGYTIYHCNFVAKFALLLFIVSVMLGVLERRYHGRLKMILLVLWGIPGSMEQAAESLYLSSKEREIARRCNDRDNMIATQVDLEKKLHDQALQMAKINAEKEAFASQLAEKEAAMASMQSELDEYKEKSK